MSIVENLEAMEQLWTALQTEANVPPPEWHRDILKRRQERIERGETTFSDLSEVRDRLRERRP